VSFFSHLLSSFPPLSPFSLAQTTGRRREAFPNQTVTGLFPSPPFEIFLFPLSPSPISDGQLNYVKVRAARDKDQNAQSHSSFFPRALLPPSSFPPFPPLPFPPFFFFSRCRKKREGGEVVVVFALEHAVALSLPLP